eukprot:3390275-Alexandrium_andersonii.AAC.1
MSGHLAALPQTARPFPARACGQRDARHREPRPCGAGLAGPKVHDPMEGDLPPAPGTFRLRKRTTRLWLQEQSCHHGR